MQPPEPQPEESDTAEEKPAGYDKIYRSIGEDRKRMLFELSAAEEPVKASELRSEEMADIPSGSMLSNIKWLQGKDVRDNLLREWPEETPPLIETVGREAPRGGGHPTRVLALTEAGEMIADRLREDTRSEPQKDTISTDIAIESHEERIANLESRIDAIEDSSDDNGEIDEVKDDLSEMQKEVKSLREDVNSNEKAARNVLDAYAEIIEMVGDMQEGGR